MAKIERSAAKFAALTEALRIKGDADQWDQLPSAVQDVFTDTIKALMPKSMLVGMIAAINGALCDAVATAMREESLSTFPLRFAVLKDSEANLSTNQELVDQIVIVTTRFAFDDRIEYHGFAVGSDAPVFLYSREPREKDAD